MTYSELKREIKKEQGQEGLAYFDYLEIHKTGKEILISNFTTKIPTENQLERAMKDGLVIRDWTTWIVKK